MNKVRRKAIEHVRASLDAERTLLEEIRDQEQEYLDNLPENMQAGEKAEKSEAYIEGLNAAMAALEEADTALDPSEFE